MLLQNIKAIAMTGKCGFLLIYFFHFEYCALPLLHEFDISVEKLPVILAVYNLFVD